MFLLSFYTTKNFFYTSYTHIYIHRDILTIPLKVTEVLSKRRVWPFIFIVKPWQLVHFYA